MISFVVVPEKGSSIIGRASIIKLVYNSSDNQLREAPAMSGLVELD